MDDYISRQAAINALENTQVELMSEEWDELTDAIMEVPSADVQPVRHGRWEKKWHSVFKEELPCCSVCNNFMAFRWRYCPNCGATMRGE